MENENRVKFYVGKDRIGCECNEDSLGKNLTKLVLALLLTILGFFGAQNFFPVFAKKLDKKLNDSEDDKPKTKAGETTQQKSVAKEEPLTDFSKPITKGRQVEFLFDKFIPKNGITLLAAAKGVGKSGICMQIAQNLARIGKYPLFNAAETKETVTVIYADYELKENQIKTRYPSLQNNDNFRWSNIRSPKSTHLLSSLRKTLNNIPTTSALVVIDNLSKIDGLGNADKAKQFYEELEVIRDEYSSKGVSVAFILVAHLEREKNIYKEITPSDLTGAASIYYYADAVLAIGTAREQGTIYLKELEIRDRDKEENVYVFKRNSSDWLHYEFVGMKTECEALPVKNRVKDSIQQDIDKIAENEMCVEEITDAEIEQLKKNAKLYTEMGPFKKEEILEMGRELIRMGKSTRETSIILLQREGVYVSHSTINSNCKAGSTRW